jgi:hypothetical protein
LAGAPSNRSVDRVSGFEVVRMSVQPFAMQ